MVKDETFRKALNKEIDDRRGYTPELGATYEEFGADDLKEFAHWGYEQAQKKLKEELKALSFSSNAMDYVKWVDTKIKELEE